MKQTRYTNNTGIPLSIAVWLCSDDYDYTNQPNHISVTTLLKSPRQIILSQRIEPNLHSVPDVSETMSRKFGATIHNSIESTWLKDYKNSLTKLGYPEKIINRIRINPEPSELSKETIPIYMEKRTFREIEGFNISGKYDFVGDGTLDDFKTTGVYYYMSGNNEWKYKLQGSLYRWLNPEIIKNDHMNIQFIFTDWVKHEAKNRADKGYPQTRMFQHKVKLMSVAETEIWVSNKLKLIKSLLDKPEHELPYCDAQDLWQDASTFKYYKNPANTTRSTKNFNTNAEAMIRWIEDGRVGTILEVPGSAKGCMYCDAFNLCTQKDILINQGTLRV